MENHAKYEIKTVSRLSGLSTHLIRMWERRYGVLHPERTETNRRLYTDEDIAKLKLLAKAVSMGLSIGSISGLSSEQLNLIVNKHSAGSSRGKETLRQEITPEEVNSEEVFSERVNSENVYSELKEKQSYGLLNEAVEAINSYNPELLREILLRASVELGQAYLFDYLIIPLIKHIGDNWQKGTLGIAQEHMASSVLVSFMQHIRSLFKNPASSPVVISAVPEREFHELGALIVSAIAASEGWNVIHLGANLPADELIKAALKSNARVICLSLVYLKDDPFINSYIEKLLKASEGGRWKIIIGGSAARSYSNFFNNSEVIFPESLSQFRPLLTELR